MTRRASSTTPATVVNSGVSQRIAPPPTSTPIPYTTLFRSVSGNTTLTVTAATLSTITVTPTDPSDANGTRLYFTSMATYCDISTQELKNQVTWISSNTAFATINKAGVADAFAAADTARTAT